MFSPLNKDGQPYAPARNIVGPIVSTIGEKAGVIVGERRDKDDEGKRVTVSKFASAHDLRRSFGFRWSRRVMPPVLKELMRHTDVSTTMRFCVGQNAQATAEELWRAVGSNPGSRPENATEAAVPQST